MKDTHDVKFREELEKMEYEPMNSTELKLVRYSIILGLALLVIFYFTSEALFPNI